MSVVPVLCLCIYTQEVEKQGESLLKLYAFSVCVVGIIRHMEFVVCERANFLSLSALPGSALEVVTEETEIQGYRMAVLREWALNRARWALLRV